MYQYYCIAVCERQTYSLDSRSGDKQAQWKRASYIIHVQSGLFHHLPSSFSVNKKCLKGTNFYELIFLYMSGHVTAAGFNACYTTSCGCMLLCCRKLNHTWTISDNWVVTPGSSHISKHENLCRGLMIRTYWSLRAITKRCERKMVLL